MTEPRITINGTVLTDAQAMTVRVAITYYLALISEPNALGNDETGLAIAAGYRDRITEIIGIMLVPPLRTHLAQSTPD